MRFDLTDLRLFVHIVEAGSITAGAARAHMTLASASQRVLGMEDALGAPLLLRSRLGVEATEAGRTLLHHARLVLLQMERLRGELGEYGAGLKGHVRLLCNTSAMTEHLPEVLAGFLALHPRIAVDVEEQQSGAIVEALREGRCDIGIVSDAVETEGLQCAPFRRDDLVAVLPRGHPLARRKRIALAEMAGCEFIGLAAGSALQQHLIAQSQRAGLRLQVRVRVGSFEALCRMVARGIGVGILPRAAAEHWSATMGLRCVALSENWAARELLVCVRPGQALPRHARQMLAHLLASSTAVKGRQ